MVVTGAPRKRLVPQGARGFESHPLRQPSPNARFARGFGWRARKRLLRIAPPSLCRPLASPCIEPPALRRSDGFRWPVRAAIARQARTRHTQNFRTLPFWVLVADLTAFSRAPESRSATSTRLRAATVSTQAVRREGRLPAAGGKAAFGGLTLRLVGAAPPSPPYLTIAAISEDHE